MGLMDKWIISRTESLNKIAEENLEKYETVKTCAFIKKYIEDLSTWYIRNSRNKFNDKNPYTRKTTYYVLNKLSKILAPLLPFVSEKIFQDINGKETSVHLQDYPKNKKSLINKTLEAEMETTRKIVSNALKQRDKEKIGIKWPLAKAIISTPIQPNKELSDIIKEELNIKKLEYQESEIIEIKLDTVITKELENEGYAREISRKIQASRKENNLIKSDTIELEIISEFNESLQSQLDSIKTKVGAKTIQLENSNKIFNYSKVGKIKEKKFEIKFNKL